MTLLTASEARLPDIENAASLQWEVPMRKGLVWLGWALLVLVPLMYGIEVYLQQDLPRLEPWQPGVFLGAIVLLYFSRDRDDVLKHHLG